VIPWMTSEFREAWSEIPQEGDQVLRADVPNICLTVVPLPVELTDIGDLRKAPKGDAVGSAQLDEQRHDVELPMDMVVRVDVCRDLPSHIREHVELPFEFLPQRSKVAQIWDPTARREVYMKAETQSSMLP